MATILLEFNNLNFKAMNKRTSVYPSVRYIRRGHNYHSEGIGTVTIMMAVVTVGIIFYSIYSSIPA